MKINIKYLVTFAILFFIEVFIALFVYDSIIRPLVGDILVIILMYTFIKSFIRKQIKLLPFYLFLFAASVEIAQYFNIVEVLNLQDNRLASTVIGTTFDARDVLCYFIGAALLFGIEKLQKYLSTC